MIAFLAGLAVGGILGAVAMLVAASLLGRNHAPELDADPALDLAALAVEVLRLMERPYWDNATVLHMANWLHAHQYTPLSAPEEIVPVVLREC